MLKLRLVSILQAYFGLGKKENFMEKKLSRNLLETLQQACDIVTKGYQTKTGNNHIKFGVLQFFDTDCSKCSC